MSVISYVLSSSVFVFSFFFSTDTSTTEIYTVSLHDALPICFMSGSRQGFGIRKQELRQDTNGESVSGNRLEGKRDRKSTRLNSSHEWISYAVFCLKKKKKEEQTQQGVRKYTRYTIDHRRRH